MPCCVSVEALEELRRVFPTRHWNFVTVDIDLDMVEAARSSILGAIYPCATQMDFNIGAALWFGAQGRGALYSFPPSASQDRVEATEPFDLTSYSAGSGVGTRGAEEEGDARLDDVLESARGDGSPVLKNPMRTDLEAAVEAIIADDPSLGVKLVVKALRLRQPQWLVGEGRVRPMVSKIKSQLRSSASPCAVVSQDACEESVGSFVAGTKSDPRQHVRGRSGVPIVDQLGAACRDRYTTPARVFLMGMGADEQLCGYSRYRSKFRVGGEEAVLADMAKDMARIWYRNLGRDDRCIADHGREARFPFLDECVVHRIKQMKLETIADLSLPPGIGDKLILRLVAGRVGISGAAKQVKRAIQFGTRIAKQSNKQTFGSNRKGSGEARILSDQVARSTC